MTPPSNNFNPQHEDNNHSAQKRIFAAYLQRNTATCTMVAEVTGIRQKCLTRYKRQLEKDGLLKVVFCAACRFTGFRAQYLSTNPDLIKSLGGGRNEG